MQKLNQEVKKYLVMRPPALKLYNELEKAGDIYLIGGVLREYRDKKEIQNIRDIDIIIDVTDEERWQNILDQYQPKNNRFGGYKLICSGLMVDMWQLKETWAYKEGIITCDSTKYLQMLPDTVFLNIDAIVYDVKNNIWYDKKYRDAMNNRVIDIVLEKNPEILLNIVRALVLKKQYKMNFSAKLTEIIKKEEMQYTDFTEFLQELMNVQIERYKKEILSAYEMKKELSL